MMFLRSLIDSMEINNGGGGGGLRPVVEDYSRQRPPQTAGFFSIKEQDNESDQNLGQRSESYSGEINSRSGDGGAVDAVQRRGKKQRKMASLFTSADPLPAPLQAKASSGGDGDDDDGATVVVAKRGRGRPPGSKNKPKPPVAATGGIAAALSPATMLPHVLEVTVGQDVVEALAGFSRRHNLGLCVLSGTGLVSNVVLRHPSATQFPPMSSKLSFPGTFEILSISATFLPPSFAPSSSLALLEGCGSVSLSLAGPNGQVFGGLVAGPLSAAGTVAVLAAAFRNPTYHRLPAGDEVSVSVSVSVSGDGQEQRNTVQQLRRQQCNSSSPSSSTAPATAAELCGKSIYGRQLPSDAIWAPAAPSPPPRGGSTRP